MNVMLYLLQVTACTVAFYLFYFLFLRRLTFFTTNRFYLLVTVVFSFLIPMLRITLSESHPYVEAVQEVIYREPKIQPDTIVSLVVQTAPVKSDTLPWDAILQAGYYIVAAALIIHLLVTLIIFFKRTRGKRIASIGKIHVLSGEQKVSNGSFLNYIFLNDDELSADEMQQIIAHELLHVKLYHSADRILIKIAQIILWFNPFIYLYAGSVEENHEFEVDREIAISTDKELYANLLLHLSIAKQGMLYHSFSKVPLKKRISMLFHKPSNKMKRITYVLVVPVVLISCLAFARMKKVDKHQPSGKKLPVFADWRNKKLQELAAWQKTDDYKQKLMFDISGKIVTVKIKSIINNEILGKPTGFLISYHHHDYILDTRFGQDKQLKSLLKVGENIELKTFGGTYDMNNKLHVGAGSIYKNGKLVFQLAETASISKQPFLSETNHVHYADGQITHIEKNINGKWKSAVLEEVNGYKFNLNFKLNTPDFKNVESGDHVRLRFVHEVKTGVKSYRINDWISITTNVNNYGIINPELFNQYYGMIIPSDVTNQDTAKYSNIPSLNKLGKNPLVLIDGKQYPADILYKISRHSISLISVIQGDEAVKKYGAKAKDGCVTIKTRTGQIAYITSAEKQNLIVESSVPASQFYSRITLKSQSGELYDKVILNTGSGTATATISHDAKTCLFIDSNFYDENDIKKLSPEIISSLSEVKVSVQRDNPDPKLKAYMALFRCKSKQPVNILDIKPGPNTQDRLPIKTVIQQKS